MNTPHDPKSTGGAPEPTDAEPTGPSGASLSKEPRTGTPSSSEPGAAPSLSKDVGTAEPSSQPYTPPPAQAGAWWEPTDAPAGPLGGQAQPGDSGQAGQPSSNPAASQQQWNTPGGQQWGAQQQSPYPPYPGSNQPQDAGSTPQYPQGGIYNYPSYGAQQTPPPGQYGAYPQPYQPYVNPPHPSGSPVYSIVGLVCGIIAVLFCPILFGPAGIILGIVGHRKGEPLGKWAAIVSAVCMVLGLIVGFLIFNGDLTT